jgi:hypothetical protein
MIVTKIQNQEGSVSSRARRTARRLSLPLCTGRRVSLASNLHYSLMARRKAAASRGQDDLVLRRPVRRMTLHLLDRWVRRRRWWATKQREKTST